MLVLYVNDMITLAKYQSDIDKLKVQLSDEFWMMNLGKAKMIIGMDIKKNIKTRKLWLDQTKFVE